MKEEIYIAAMNGIHMTEDMAERILQNCRTAARKSTPGLRRPVRLALIAAACIIALVGAALAATYSVWSPTLARVFGADEAAQAELTDSRVAVAVGVSDSDGGLTVTAEQVIGDEFGVYVLLRLDSEDPGLLDYYASPDFRIYIDGKRGGYLGGHGGWADGYGKSIPELEKTRTDGPMYFAWWIHADEGEALNGHEITFSLKKITDLDVNMNEVTGSGDFPVLWKGDIALTWTLDYNTDTASVYTADGTIHYEDLAISVERVCVSPISVCVYFDGVPEKSYFGQIVTIDDSYDQLSSYLSPVGLTMADGTYYNLDLGGGSGGYVTDSGGKDYWRTLVEAQGQLIGQGAPVSLTFAFGEAHLEIPIYPAG